MKRRIAMVLLSLCLSGGAALGLTSCGSVEDQHQEDPAPSGMVCVETGTNPLTLDCRTR